MIRPKIKKVFLLILLLIISGTLTVIRSITGHSKTSQAEACWLPPPLTSSSGNCTEGAAGGDCAGGDCCDY